MILNGKVKTVINYGRNAPKKFYELIKRIDETANTRQWITDECDIIAHQYGLGQIVSKENKPNFPCEENKKCGWKEVTRYKWHAGGGSTPETFYACCPKEEGAFLSSRCR